MEERIEKLEILTMEQDATIESLNQEVRKQQLHIQELEMQIEILSRKLTSAIENDSLISEVIEKPPHY